MESIGDSLIIDVPGDATLVFGMRWFPIIGSHVDALARKRARDARATHYVYGGLRAAAVGCARLRGRPKACYAAAQVFAHAHPQGTAAALLTLDDGRAWLVASQDGAVMARTDRIYGSAAQATQALAELGVLYPGLELMSPRQLDVATLASWLDPAAALWRVGTLLGRLPMPVQGMVALLLFALFAPPAWQAWRTRSPARPAADAPVDAAQAWRNAMSAYAARTPVHSSSQMGQVFGSLRKLPAGVRGWALQSAQCRPDGRDWACSASYARVAPNATNGEFADALPAERKAHFQTLDEARMVWRVPGLPVLLDPAALPRPAQTDIVLAGALQRIRPVFAQIALGESSLLAVPAPLDARGQPLPPPAGLPRLRRRSLSLRGPLRSFSLFANPPATTAWSEIALVLAAGREPTSKGSALTAHLQGVVYEQE